MPLTRDLAIGFSRLLLKSEIPAWQRQQAVKTLAVYRDLILETAEPLLTDVIRKLGQMAEQEPNENRDFGWQWIFPAAKLSKDPRCGIMSQHHVGEDLLGHKDVQTTMIYTHVMNKPGIAVKSPADTI